VRPPRLLRTASFKLAGLYALIFGVSVTVLAAVIYFTATSALDQRIRQRIQSEVAALQDEYRSGGIPRLQRAIEERQRGHLIDGLDYALFDAGGKRLFGTLSGDHAAPGWTRITGPPDGDEPPGQDERLAVYVAPLSGGGWLFVGDDIGQVGELGDVILRAFGWVLLLTVTLAIVGGLALSASFLRRVEAIATTADAIAQGDLRRRIPQYGPADELTKLSGTLNRMLDRIETLMEALRQVTNDIAHDLRTPLGRLRQSLEESRRTAAGVADYETAVEGAILEADAILGTFSALLRIAQIEARTRRSGFRKVDLSELACGICQAFGPAVEDAGKNLVADIVPELIVDGDRALLTQMVVNLVENAIAHTPAGVSIRISVARDAGCAVLAVADTGPGVPEGERERIFQRFYRAERSRTTQGNGLGLSLVAAIADLHGIAIAVEDNRPGLVVAMRFRREAQTEHQRLRAQPTVRLQEAAE
jgi:signal transduction histidine kinase